MRTMWKGYVQLNQRLLLVRTPHPISRRTSHLPFFTQTAAIGARRTTVTRQGTRLREAATASMTGQTWGG